MRLSRKTNVETLYYARKYRNVYITTSTPFEIEGVIMTSGQKDYIYILIGLVAFLFGSIIVITNTILKPLKSFREFISVLKSGEKDFSGNGRKLYRRRDRCCVDIGAGQLTGL